MAKHIEQGEIEGTGRPLWGEYLVKAYNQNWIGMEIDVTILEIIADCEAMALDKAKMGAARKHYQVLYVTDEKCQKD